MNSWLVQLRLTLRASADDQVAHIAKISTTATIAHMILRIGYLMPNDTPRRLRCLVRYPITRLQVGGDFSQAFGNRRIGLTSGRNVQGVPYPDH
ncbi:MAG: hypothetical protein IPM02_08090 [Betaproteobacteria bacterium]|nr:hypothetical protein [Betaproteobacteria bacterium]